MSPKIYRAFINQPSTLQPLHKLHGKVCIVYDCGEPTISLFFTEGLLHSMSAVRECVSKVEL